MLNKKHKKWHKKKIQNGAWKIHIRNLFDEILQNNDHMQIFDKPFRVTMALLGAMAEHAAEVKDEKMIGYFCRLGIYNFSDPTNKEEFDQKRTDYYISKTK